MTYREELLIERDALQQLLDTLKRKSYRIVGPRLRDGAIVYDELKSINDLPAGWTEIQEAGNYRVRKRADNALFGYLAGPHSWKRFLHEPRIKLWQLRRKDHAFIPAEQPQHRLAFLGVRSCDLAAITIQDKVLMGSSYVDTAYAVRRDGAFIVAINCGEAGGTCFCTSMNTGPRARAGFDIALTEIIDDPNHYFIAEIGSEAGRIILSEVAHRTAQEHERQAATRAIEHTIATMGRRLDTHGLKELLYRNYESPRWDDVAARCLACTNCTMACPTCFCTSVEDITDLTGEHAERWRRWDSCFTQEFSYIHGGTVRDSIRSRYRQWLTHKLATWFDQFGTSGCVGCGRCITWCPTAIDITAEVSAIRKLEAEKEENSE